jgi:hypothetical protein
MLYHIQTHISIRAQTHTNTNTHTHTQTHTAHTHSTHSPTHTLTTHVYIQYTCFSNSFILSTCCVDNKTTLLLLTTIIGLLFIQLTCNSSSCMLSIRMAAAAMKELEPSGSSSPKITFHTTCYIYMSYHMLRIYARAAAKYSNRNIASKICDEFSDLNYCHNAWCLAVPAPSSICLREIYEHNRQFILQI